MMGLENDVEDLNLDFSDRSINTAKPKVLTNLAFEYRLSESSGASSLESLDFGYDDGFIYDHSLEFPAIHVEKDEHDGFIDDDHLEYLEELPVKNEQNEEPKIQINGVKEDHVTPVCATEVKTKKCDAEVLKTDVSLTYVPLLAYIYISFCTEILEKRGVQTQVRLTAR